MTHTKAPTRPAIIVTGASSGIGRELALVAAGDHQGSEFLLVARSRPALEALATELSQRAVKAHVIVLDLAEPGAGDVIMAELDRLGLHCDVLVNNAGFGLAGAAAEIGREAQLALVDVNVRAATDLALTVLPGMIARGCGGILNVASLAGYFAGPYMAAYYASKNYLRAFSEALSRETRGTGVTVTCLCPGPVATDFFARAQMGLTRLVRHAPMMDAAEVARTGWRGLHGGRRVVVPGWQGRIVAAVGCCLPRTVSLWAIARLHRRKSTAH